LFRLKGDGTSRANFTGELMAQVLCRSLACQAPTLPGVVPVAPLIDSPPAAYPPPQISTQVYDNVPSYSTRYSDDTINNGAYTEYLIEGKIKKKMGRLHVPYTQPLPGYTPGGPPNPNPPQPNPNPPGGGAILNPGGGSGPFAIPTPPVVTSTVLQLHLPMSEIEFYWTG
jgi:hypothetical protein